MQLSDVRAVITGGVSGLGLATAQHLAGKGAKVALFDVNEEKGAQAAASLGATFHKVDVANEAEVADAVAKAKDAMGGLNAAINCAGILGAGRVLGKEGPMPLAGFQGTVMVNLVGSFNLAKAAANRIQHNDAGPDG